MSQKLRRYFKKIVPGVITGAADNDPAGIATYSISGALFGFAQLWLMVLAAPMAIAVQSMFARLGDLKKQGLVTILLAHFPRWIAVTAVVVLVVTNTVTIGADVLAMGASFEILTGIAMGYWIIPVVAGIWYLVVFANYRTIRKALLVTIPFLGFYILAAFLARPDWGEVLRGIFIPKLIGVSPEYYVAAVGILGTTLTPYLFFWHIKEQSEEHKSKSERLAQVKHEDRINAPGFILSQIITLFIMISAGATLFESGIVIDSAADAALALEPIAGPVAKSLFALGIIGAGLIALPVLAISTAYALSELLGFKHESLHNKPKSAKGFYGIITLSFLAGVVIWLLGINPIPALFYSQVLAGLLTPILLVLVLILVNRKSVMGEYTASKFENIFGVIALIFTVAAGIMMFATM